MTQEPSPQRRRIESEARTSATPQQAWEAFADPQRLIDWWIDQVHGEPGIGEGVVWAWESLGMRSPVKVVESAPGRRLVLELDEGPGLVLWEIDVARQGGETVVRVVCSGFGDGDAWDEHYDGMKGGQPGLMRALKYYLDNHFGRRRRVIEVMRDAPDPEATRLLLSPVNFTRWLAREAQVGGPGEPVRLVLQDGRTWTGSLTTASDGTVDMSCDQIGGFVFMMCWQRRVWFSVKAWLLDGSAAGTLQTELSAAIDRLVALSSSK